MQPGETIVRAERLPSVLSTETHLQALVASYLNGGGPVSFDIETTGLDPRQDRLVMIQVQQPGRRPIVIDCRRWTASADTELEEYDQLRHWGHVLAPLFTGRVLIVGFNLKFDLGFVREKLGLQATRVYDVMLAEQVLLGLGKSDAKAVGVGLSLQATAARYGQEMSKEARSWFIDLDQRPDDWQAAFPAEQLAYGAKDVAVLHPIMCEQQAKLRELGLTKTAKLEMDCLPALVEVEHAGVLVDAAGWRDFIAEKTEEAARLEDETLKVFGPPIMQARQEQYDAALAVHQAWEKARDEAVARAKAQWEEDPTDDNNDPITWGKYKNWYMGQWRNVWGNPNPGKPKADNTLPNLGSPKQLIEAFTRLGIPLPTKRDPKTGKTTLSTGAAGLDELALDYPVVTPLATWRKAEKFVTSFGEALLQYVDPTTGRIHPEYQQIGASTGRMSCSRPNWQQVPSKGDGTKLRALVKAEYGNVILTADFSNVELRILADMSGDRRMLQMFESGLDLHSYTAKMMFGLDDTVDVKHEEAYPGVTYRQAAKVINFGLVYGMSATKLARTLKISRDKAQELLDVYFNLYPGVAQWLAKQRTLGLQNMESKTYLGRKRFYSLPMEPARPFTRDVTAINEWQEAVRQWKGSKHRIERQAMNTPIQGTSADITKQALALLYKRLLTDPDYKEVRVIAIVHDEFVVECPEGDADTVSRLLAECMYDAAATYLTRVHLPPVDVAVADHWSKD